MTNRPVVEVGVDRSQASQAEAVAAAEQVAAATGIDAAPYVKQVRAAGDKAFVKAITYRADEVPPERGRAAPTALPACCSSTTSSRWPRPATSRRRSSARSATSPRR